MGGGGGEGWNSHTPSPKSAAGRVCTNIFVEAIFY